MVRGNGIEALLWGWVTSCSVCFGDGVTHESVFPNSGTGLLLSYHIPYLRPKTRYFQSIYLSIIYLSYLSINNLKFPVNTTMHYTTIILSRVHTIEFTRYGPMYTISAIRQTSLEGFLCVCMNIFCVPLWIANLNQ